MRILSLVLVGLLGCSLALADEAVVAIGGWQHTTSSAYEDSGTASLRYEHRLYKNLWIGPEYTYHGPMSHNTGEDVSYGDVSGHSVLLDAIYYPSWLVLLNVHPYLIGGMGWSWWDFDNNTEVDIELGDAFTYKVGLGATYAINESWSILVEWSFFKADIPKDATNPDGSTSRILGDDNGKIGEEEFMLTIGAKYSW